MELGMKIDAVLVGYVKNRVRCSHSLSFGLCVDLLIKVLSMLTQCGSSRKCASVGKSLHFGY
jgi:hypothetical protein